MSELVPQFPGAKLRLKRLYDFAGGHVVKMLVAGIFVGLLLFCVEIAFAYGLQSFLVALKLMQPDLVNLPAWIPQSSLGKVLGFILAVGIVRGGLQWAQIYMQSATSEDFRCLQRSRILRWAFFNQSASTNEITTLYNETSVSVSNIIMSLLTFSILLPTTALLGLTLIKMAPLLTLVSALIMVPLAILIQWSNRLILSAGRGLALEWDRTNRRMLMNIKNLLLLQIYGTQATEEALTQKSLAAYRKHLGVYEMTMGFKFAAPQIFGVALICFIALAGNSIERLPPSVFISYFYLFGRMIQTFSSLNQSTGSLFLYKPQLKKLLIWWDEYCARGLGDPRSTSALPKAAKPFEKPIGWVLRDVSFCYPLSEEPVFQNLNLVVNPREALVITGPSGVGKSTLIQLLLGGVKPDQGSIELTTPAGTGEMTEELRARLLCSSGYVGPESFIFEGSIMENLEYGLTDRPSEQKIRETLLQAECNFVFDLPGQLNYQLTEQGQGLSAGQKQRLALARALLRSPTVLLLDEATSNLDMDTEARLIDTLSLLKGKMTIVAVTHRTGFLRLADQHFALRAPAQVGSAER